MAIDNSGITSLDTGASDITYSGNQGPKSPDQQLMASADPMLVEEYHKYVFEMEEQGLQPISFREFVQQIMAESRMAQGGRAGYQSGTSVKPLGISEEEWEQMLGIKGPRPLSSQSPYLSVHADGGRAGYQSGGGADWINTHEPGPRGNPAVMEEIEDMREWRIANPNVEDITDYKGYYERLKKLEELKRLKEMMGTRSAGMTPMSGAPVYSEQDYPQFNKPGTPFHVMPELNTGDYAYGGTAHPTYTQSRKQRMADGGIASMRDQIKYGIGPGEQLTGKPGGLVEHGVGQYGILSKIKKGVKKVTGKIADLIPNEIKDNPTLTAALVGGSMLIPGVGPMVQGGLGAVGKGIMSIPGVSSIPGTQTLANLGSSALTGMGNLRGAIGTGATNLMNKIPGMGGGGSDAINEELQRVVGGYPNPDLDKLDPWYKKVAQTIIPGGKTGYMDLYGSTPMKTAAGTVDVNWKGPLAAGLSIGALDKATRKTDMMPQDTSGIDIANIRSRALTGSDPNLHFLPPASATTAYAQGGRTGYYAGDSVGQDENIIIKAFSIYKNKGGPKDFSEWYSDDYLPETGYQTRRPDTPYTPDTIGPDPWAEGAPYGFAEPGTIGSPEMISIGQAQGGRIGAQEGGLMNLGGMEKDYRQEGGFVPIGGEERADDVPARLSKNEFVFTADAVRSAGGGDIDAGAEVMENVMNNLEQGGTISEESQGLEGARDMFATAQRLEGVM